MRPPLGKRLFHVHCVAKKKKKAHLMGHLFFHFVNDLCMYDIIQYFSHKKSKRTWKSSMTFKPSYEVDMKQLVIKDDLRVYL